jgi:gliding motility-associated-like protein
VVVILSPTVKAQLNATIIGDAINQGNNCYTITQNLEFQSGGVWYDNPIDFDEDFTILYQNNFGSLDANGADGMALVFKRTATPQLGNAGGGVGYEGISPSLVIEFDTYQNGELGDPSFDHISIMRNGNPNHNNGASNLSGPIQASATNINIEDGDTHEVKIEWIAATNTLNVYFDCVFRLTLNQDVKSTIFSGDDSVFFGFVGSTGGLTNIHEVCFNSISFVDNLQLQDDFICLGSSKVIDATIPSGNTYSWSPTTGISNPNIPNPVFSPTVTTTYTVTISDVCGDTTVEEFTLSVFPVVDPVFNLLSPICEGAAIAPLPVTSLNGISGSWSPQLNNTQTTTYTFTPNEDECAVEVGLTIVVIPSITPVFDSVATICPGEFLEALPTISNNGISGVWSPELDNTQTTTYTFTPDPDQGCAVTTTLEILVSDPVIAEFDEVDFICAGETSDGLLPLISLNGISGNWFPEFNNTETTTYTFTPNPNQCSVETTLTIQVLPIAELTVAVELISIPFDDNQSVRVLVTGGTGNYEYKLDNETWVQDPFFTRISGCQDHVMAVRETSGCSNIAIATFRIFEFPKFFTPNGDGINDVWNIGCLDNQTNANITIFDRYGKILKVINPARSGWDGSYNGELMPTNDYWFKLDYLDDAGAARTFSSHFTLKR